MYLDRDAPSAPDLVGGQGAEVVGHDVLDQPEDGRGQVLEAEGEADAGDHVDVFGLQAGGEVHERVV